MKLQIKKQIVKTFCRECKKEIEVRAEISPFGVSFKGVPLCEKCKHNENT